MTTLKWIGGFFAAGMLILLLVFFIGTCNTGAALIQNAQKMVYDQYKPEELLRKYEWFKDAAAQLDAKLSNLEGYEARFVDMRKNYGKDSLNRTSWGREDKEQWNIWQSESVGLKASYNDLSAQYNAAMVKFNYRFCNRGDLPQGATEVLPREYRTYIK